MEQGDGRAATRRNRRDSLGSPNSLLWRARGDEGSCAAGCGIGLEFDNEDPECGRTATGQGGGGGPSERAIGRLGTRGGTLGLPAAKGDGVGQPGGQDEGGSGSYSQAVRMRAGVGVTARRSG